MSCIVKLPMAHLFLQKREGERKERCVKSCMALLNEKVGFRVLQISSKMLMYIFMTLGYRLSEMYHYYLKRICIRRFSRGILRFFVEYFDTNCKMRF